MSQSEDNVYAGDVDVGRSTQNQQAQYATGLYPDAKNLDEADTVKRKNSGEGKIRYRPRGRQAAQNVSASDQLRINRKSGKLFVFGALKIIVDVKVFSRYILRLPVYKLESVLRLRSITRVTVQKSTFARKRGFD